MTTTAQYAWNDVTLALGVRVVAGIRSVSVEDGYEHEEVRASGSKAHSINQKGYSVNGSIKVLQSEYEALRESYGRDFGRTYFDIVWSFVPEVGGVQMNTHVVKGAKFGKAKMEIKEGDAMMEVELPFIALDFEMNKR